MRLKLAELMSRSGLSQSKVAAGLETSRQNVSNWASGKVFPGDPWLDRIAAFFEINDVRDLLELEPAKAEGPMRHV